MDVIDIFRLLAEIPSPSKHEEAVADKIVELLTSFGAAPRKDAAGNVVCKIPATDAGKKPLMLTGHMDVVGDDSPVNIRTSEDGRFFETDKKRTLGADDKAGVSCALALAKELCASSDVRHGGLELAFTRDEECDLTGARALDIGAFDSEYVLVLDADAVGELQVAGAGFTKMTLSVSHTKGGHSGIDIADASRVNAVKVLGEAINAVPQGVYKTDEKGVVASINIGAVAGGGLKNLPSETRGADFCAFLTGNAAVNVINTDAVAVYSIRSSDRAVEAALRREIEEIVADMNEKYAAKAAINVVFDERLPPFEASDDPTMVDVFKKAASACGIAAKVSSFHAAAETHLYAGQKNARGVAVKPYLTGAANIFNMHSANERVEIQSIRDGARLIKETFLTFNGLR